LPNQNGVMQTSQLFASMLLNDVHAPHYFSKAFPPPPK
jgi:hypothetical protein